MAGHYELCVFDMYIISIFSNDGFKEVIQNVPIDFDFSGPMLNTNASADANTNTITVSISGVYEITAGLVSTTNECEVVQYDIRRNNVPIPGSRFQVSFINTRINIEKTIQVSLVAGDTVSVVPLTEVGTVQYSSAALAVNRIG